MTTCGVPWSVALSVGIRQGEIERHWRMASESGHWIWPARRASEGVGGRRRGSSTRQLRGRKSSSSGRLRAAAGGGGRARLCADINLISMSFPSPWFILMGHA